MTDRDDDDAPPPPDATDNYRATVLTLPATSESVARARRAVVEQWSWLDDTVLEYVETVVAELVANAVQHGQPEIELRLQVAPSAVDVAVLDHGAGRLPPEAATSAATATSGRGLAIVDALANFWGVEYPADGCAAKTVWASVSR